MNHLNAPIAPTHGRTEIVLPGATTSDIVSWASNVTEANPIVWHGGESDEPVRLEIDGELFMGLELTFFVGEQRIHSIALFADTPNENEVAIMKQEGHHV